MFRKILLSLYLAGALSCQPVPSKTPRSEEPISKERIEYLKEWKPRQQKGKKEFKTFMISLMVIIMTFGFMTRQAK